MTDTTTLTNWIDSELISRVLSSAVDTPFIGPDICSIFDIRTSPTLAYAKPYMNHLDAAAAHSSTETISAVSMSLGQATISSAEYTRLLDTADIAFDSTVVDLTEAQVRALVQSLRARLDTSLLNLASTMTNVHGSNSQVMTMNYLNQRVGSFRANAKWQGKVALVLGVRASQDLQEDLQTTAASIYASAFGEQTLAALRSQGWANQGLKGALPGGILVYESDRVPVGDTSGRFSFLTALHETDGGLGLVVKKEMEVVGQFDIDQNSRKMLGRMHIGVGILDDAKCYAMITRNSG